MVSYIIMCGECYVAVFAAKIIIIIIIIIIVIFIIL